MTLQEYLDLCKSDPTTYATAAERMLLAIGEPELIDTRKNPRLSRIFSNKMIKIYPAFKDFYGMEDTIDQIVSFYKHAAQGLEEKKQILYLLGPVGGGKSSLAEKLKSLMEKIPFYAIKGSPVNESPLCLFSPSEDARILEEDYGMPRRYLSGIMSPWAIKRLKEFNGDITKFKVVGGITVALGHGWVVLTQLTVFLLRVMLLCSLQILIRWTLPRFRYDQVLKFAWKFMLPLALANLTVTAVAVWALSA